MYEQVLAKASVPVWRTDLQRILDAIYTEMREEYDPAA